MIRYSTYPNSPDCYQLMFVDPPTRKEREIHIHISEIRRFFGHHPHDRILYTHEELLKFFTYRLNLEGQSGEYGKKKAKSQARLHSKRPKAKPNSPGEGEQ